MIAFLALLLSTGFTVLILTERESPRQEWVAWIVVVGSAGFAVYMLSQGIGS